MIDFDLHPDWNQLRLHEAQPYWVLGLLPLRYLPDIAMNEMEAGNLQDEVVALAVRSEDELWNQPSLIVAAFAAVGLDEMPSEKARKMVREAKHRIAPGKMRDVAQAIVAGDVAPLRGANGYLLAYWVRLPADGRCPGGQTTSRSDPGIRAIDQRLGGSLPRGESSS